MLKKYGQNGKNAAIEEVTMNLNELREAMASDATKENEKLKEEDFNKIFTIKKNN